MYCSNTLKHPRSNKEGNVSFSNAKEYFFVEKQKMQISIPHAKNLIPANRKISPVVTILHLEKPTLIAGNKVPHKNTVTRAIIKFFFFIKP